MNKSRRPAPSATPAEAVAIVHPGDTIIWPMAEGTTIREGQRFVKSLREMFDPLGVRVSVVGSQSSAVIIIRGFSGDTPIYDETAGLL